MILFKNWFLFTQLRFSVVLRQKMEFLNINDDFFNDLILYISIFTIFLISSTDWSLKQSEIEKWVIQKIWISFMRMKIHCRSKKISNTASNSTFSSKKRKTILREDPMLYSLVHDLLGKNSVGTSSYWRFRYRSSVGIIQLLFLLRHQKVDFFILIQTSLDLKGIIFLIVRKNDTAFSLTCTFGFLFLDDEAEAFVITALSKLEVRLKIINVYKIIYILRFLA